MFITICLIILGYMIVGKDVKPWVEKLNSKVKDKITPAINLKVDETIEDWFGPDYSVSEAGYIE